MPWKCSQCTTDVADDAVTLCPGCGQAKTSWTVMKNQTRTLRVGAGKRFVCERGEADAPVDAPLGEAYDAASWVETEVAPAIPTADARALAEAGQGPAPSDVLRVVQHPGKSRPSTVMLSIPESKLAALTEREARSGPPHDVRFLLVFGEPPEGLTFDGVEVIDVTAERAEGHAEAVEVTALKRPLKRLPITPRAAEAIDWTLFGFDVAQDDDEVDWDLFTFDVARGGAEAD